jgi:FKBP-type peptidyl-prolyl cis-trans isomerase 2
MTFKDGDFLEVEYTVWDVGTNSIISTTDEKKAKDAKIFDEKMQYGPVLIILGSRGVIKGLDRDLRDLKEGEQKKLTFKPEDAFGERSEEYVRVMPLSEFRAREIDPYPGMQVNLDNVTAIVKSVNSGRVVVDANHPYAGKEIAYDVKVLKLLNSDKEKVEALSKSYGVKPTQITATTDRLEIFYNNDVSKNADYFIGRASLLASVFSNFKNMKAIEIKEEYLRPKAADAKVETEK